MSHRKLRVTQRTRLVLVVLAAVVSAALLGCPPVMVSDRNAKQDVEPLDGREVLEKVAVLPVSTWSYKGGDDVRHAGPMAQDFHAAFGFGSNDKGIVSIDAHGVALAAIQGLNEVMKEENAALREELAEKDAAIRALEERLAVLEAASAGHSDGG